jgi:sugar O-acyltransferase (sialic acid O-acetyltransferase NeuD family)
MSTNTIVAPHINANDLEMVLVEWFFEPWEFVNQGDVVCEVETTKAVSSIESEFTGYMYPLINGGEFVKVGEPIAHVFPNNDKKQIEVLEKPPPSESSVIVSKKAQSLLKEFGLSISDFPKYSSISSETVVAKVRELEIKQVSSEDKRIEEDLDLIKISDNSVVIYGELNQALLALDCFISNDNFKVVGYVNPSYKSELFHGIPALHSSVFPKLKDRGLKYVYLCGQNSEVKSKQLDECKRIGLECISAIHSSAIVSDLAQLGEGIFIGAQVVIGPEAVVGDFSQVLCGATIAHHAKLGRYVTISDGSKLGGNVQVGDRSLVGIGVNINKRIAIGRESTIVSGATVIDNVPDNMIYRLNAQIAAKH